MDILNNKVKSTQDETRFETQNVGLYGYDSTATQWRRLVCDSEGKQKIEATLELDSSGLAKEATLTDGTQKAKCMGITGAGLQQQILVETNGSSIIGGGAVKTGADSLSNTTHLLTSTNGGILCGNTVGDGSGTATSLKTASDGSVHVVVENSDNVLIKGIQDGTTTQKDAKTNSNGDLRSALIGNTIKDGTGDNYYVLVDSDGKLQTSGGGGGGSTQYAVATTGMATGTGTLMIGSASGSAKEVNVSSAGSINTKATELQNEGSTGNLNPASGTSMAPGTFSLVVDISNMREGSVLYNDSSTSSFDGLDIEVSADGSTFYRLDGLFPFVSGGVRTAFRSVSLHGLTHLRLENTSSSDTYTSVSATVVGCP